MDRSDQKIDLSVQLGRLGLNNPVMTASGTFGYGDEAPKLTDVAALGAIVTKTVTLEARTGNPPPRLQETPAGLLNSIGLQNVGARRFATTVLPGLKDLGPPVIVSIGGHCPDDYLKSIETVDCDTVAAFELNFSCPNVSSGMELSRSPEAAAKMVARVREMTDKPFFAKLSPNVTDIVSVGQACCDAGADALVAVNTYLGMAIDIETERPVFVRNVGGLSGPAIRPLALCRVWQLAQAVSKPVIGAGGIVTAADAMQFFLAGATAVQIGTANFRDPARGAHVVAGLETLLRAKGVSSISDKIGKLKPHTSAR
jgi:dihydroorotate dehydrogenase (NAD+) catalytic subunit